MSEIRKKATRTKHSKLGEEKTSVNEGIKNRAIELLRRGEQLPPEWARELFPPEKREYELLYYGKEREEDVLAETMALPLQPSRTFGTNGDAWSNILIFGDNLQAMKTLLAMKEERRLTNGDGTPGVRLIYIDPPFGTGDEYGHGDAETAYSAKVQGALFVEFLRKRLIVMRDLLSTDGSIYVRLDYHFGHYLKAIMDEVFGPGRFQNEIIINRFKRQLTGLTKYNIATDSLFFYSRGAVPLFNEQKRSRRCSFCGQEKEPDWHHIWSSGTRNPPERHILGRLLHPARGQHFKYTQEKINVMEKEGRIRINDKPSYTDSKGNRIQGVPEFLQTEDSIVDSEWTDLRGYVLSGRYPTENHEELLERIVRASSKQGDIVLDAFAGSGTACAVAEKLDRRWIGIDCGKLAIYTIQKRMLTLKAGIGNTGRPLKPKPFTLYNAGLYDFSTLRKLPWADWRFFALQLFGCKDEPHNIGGLELDGKLKGGSVLVFNHLAHEGQRIDEDTVRDIHDTVGRKIGRKFFIIAPRGVFDFQQDYIDFDGVRYYALRIPYSVINELHQREFSALKQPSEEADVNAIVDAVGFDFIQPPRVEWSVSRLRRQNELIERACLKISAFESRARVHGHETRGGLETFSMLMLDFDYNGEVFDLDAVFYAHRMEGEDWRAFFDFQNVGERVMAVFIDIYGNESREVIPRDKFVIRQQRAPSNENERVAK
jgi:site-specific DNA-methyltransferase (adenine-specific)/adenine-specific DNA-methyltransferase